MIDKNTTVLGVPSVRRQCVLVSLARGQVYYTSAATSEENLAIMRELDKLYFIAPWMGARRLSYLVSKALGVPVGRKRVTRLRRIMGLHTIYRAPRTSIPAAVSKRFPYLLHDLEITRHNQVWATDITYIPMQGGFLYLVAVIDWYSRKILSWRLSSTMESEFCVEALRDAIRSTGRRPEIFNTDQGAQFTSELWLDALRSEGIAISMDGKGRWIDNVMIERFWRSLKYEDIYLRDYVDGRDLERGISKYIALYNDWRPHETFDYLTPSAVYSGATSPPKEAQNAAA
jgi:putative transposase